MSKFVKGMDLSTLLEMERCGAKYYDHGQEMDILDIMKKYDVDTIRLRLWNDPKSESGEPYGAGNNDLAETIAIGKRVTDAGLGVLLNFHYSDFWADPGKQIKPKAWASYGVEELEKAVYDFTKDSLQQVLDAGVNVTMIQVGNELSNGLLWPEGQLPNYDNVAKFVSAGIRAGHCLVTEHLYGFFFTGENTSWYANFAFPIVKSKRVSSFPFPKNTAIDVHALKSSALLIGACELSELAKELEAYGKEENLQELKEKTPIMLELYRSYKQLLLPYIDKEETSKKTISADEWISCLQQIHQYVDTFDLDGVDRVMKQLDEYRVPASIQDYVEKLRVCVADVAMEDIMNLTTTMVDLLRE